MKENLAKSVEILTNAMESIKEVFDEAIINGNDNRIERCVINMCELSRVITGAVHTQSDFTPDVAMAIIERMKADWDRKAKDN